MDPLHVQITQLREAFHEIDTNNALGAPPDYEQRARSYYPQFLAVKDSLEQQHLQQEDYQNLTANELAMKKQQMTGIVSLFISLCVKARDSLTHGAISGFPNFQRWKNNIVKILQSVEQKREALLAYNPAPAPADAALPEPPLPQLPDAFEDFDIQFADDDEILAVGGVNEGGEGGGAGGDLAALMIDLIPTAEQVDNAKAKYPLRSLNYNDAILNSVIAEVKTSYTPIQKAMIVDFVLQKRMQQMTYSKSCFTDIGQYTNTRNKLGVEQRTAKNEHCIEKKGHYWQPPYCRDGRPYAGGCRKAILKKNPDGSYRLYSRPIKVAGQQGPYEVEGDPKQSELDEAFALVQNYTLKNQQGQVYQPALTYYN